MPHGNHPNRLSLDSLEEAVGGDYELTVGQVGKFWDHPPGLREFLKPSHDRFGPLPKTGRYCGIILTNMG